MGRNIQSMSHPTFARTQEYEQELGLHEKLCGINLDGP